MEMWNTMSLTMILSDPIDLRGTLHNNTQSRAFLPQIIYHPVFVLCDPIMTIDPSAAV